MKNLQNTKHFNAKVTQVTDHEQRASHEERDDLTKVDQGDFILEKHQSVSSKQRERVQVQKASHPLPNNMIITEDPFLKASEGIEYAKKVSSLIMSTTVIEEEVTQSMPHQVKPYIMQENNYYPFQSNNNNELIFQAVREKFPNYFPVK